MRENLFKAKRVNDGGWSVGDLVSDLYGEKMYIHNRISGVPSFNGDFLGSMIVLAEVIPETVCQFSGKTTKEGNKIFEGDIVEEFYTNRVYEVVFICSAFRLRQLNCGYNENISKYGRLEIIGNIHDEDGE